jgi:hypothetical protein
VVGGRGLPDPEGRRPYAIYLFVVSFIATFVALGALATTVSSVTELIVADDQAFVEPGFSPPGFSPPGGEFPGFKEYDPDDQRTASAVQSALAAAVAILILWFHHVRIKTEIGRAGFATGAVRATLQAYVYAACFVAILIGLFALASAAYAVFRLIAPGVTGVFTTESAERDAAVVSLVSSLFLVAGAYGIWRYQWRRGEALLGGGTVAAEPETEPEPS